MGVSFDLFGTLIEAETPDEPAAAVAAGLSERGVSVPEGWTAAYREIHVEAKPGAEVALPRHVRAALRSCGVEASQGTVRRAVADAFEPAVTTRAGAEAAVAAAAADGPVGVLSNCSVPGLAGRALERSSIDADRFDAIVTSVGCGWRKPDARAFAAVAAELGVSLSGLTHVGDDGRTDGGLLDADGRVILLEDVPLPDVPEVL